MIPTLITLPNSPWKVLPQGIHKTTLAEVHATFATTTHRRQLFNGLVKAAGALAFAGGENLYVDGSFVTGKPKPNDFDGCWDPTGINPTLLDPVLLDFTNKRQNQKIKYGGELFPSVAIASPATSYLDFFQIDRHSGLVKGILLIDLQTDPHLALFRVKP